MRYMRAILVLLMSCSVFGKDDPFYFSEKGTVISEIELKIGDSRGIEIAAAELVGYDALLTFEGDKSLGEFVLQAVMPDAGAGAYAQLVSQRPWQCVLHVPRPVREGVHFLFSYEATQVGQTRLLLDYGAGSIALGINVLPEPTGTGFVYQGRLHEAGEPATGLYDFQFRLFYSSTGGQIQGEAVTCSNVTVTNGYFSVLVDPAGGDAEFYNGDAYWLEILVRPGGSSGTYVALRPRQSLNAAPYAVTAAALAGAAAESFAGVEHEHDGGAITSGIVEEAFIDPAMARVEDVAAGLAGRALLNHTHRATDITAGIIGEAFIDSAITRDSELAAALLGKSNVGHSHSAGDIISGVLSESLIPSSIARDSEIRWDRLIGIPSGFADGIDDVGVSSVTAGTGLSGGGTGGVVILNVEVPLVLSSEWSTPVIKATSSMQEGHGIEAVAEGASGRAVYGKAINVTAAATGYGGYFETASGKGRAVYGIATSTAGTAETYGGYFETTSNKGAGVRGVATGAAGGESGPFSYGGDFESASEGGAGVRGVATNAGRGYGGYFESAAADGAAVRGVATSTSSAEFGPYSYGGCFESSAWNGAAVLGHAKATAQNGVSIGGQFTSDAGRGYGLWSVANGFKGTGIYAKSDGDEGKGGHFECRGTTGTGIYARGGAQGYAAILRGKVLIEDVSTGDPVIELGKGLDYAEGFDVSASEAPAAGTVMVIDALNPGKLAVSGSSYDTKVAGIVAGAQGVGSGVRLGAGRFDCDVALAGRVYCNVDASEVGVEAGDLLTTSDVPGHAMKATDYEKGRGAILGKAMEPLEKGKTGQILVLVTLQ